MEAELTIVVRCGHLVTSPLQPRRTKSAVTVFRGLTHIAKQRAWSCVSPARAHACVCVSVCALTIAIKRPTTVSAPFYGARCGAVAASALCCPGRGAARRCGGGCFGSASLCVTAGSRAQRTRQTPICGSDEAVAAVAAAAFDHALSHRHCRRNCCMPLY